MKSRIILSCTFLHKKNSVKHIVPGDWCLLRSRYVSKCTLCDVFAFIFIGLLNSSHKGKKYIKQLFVEFFLPAPDDGEIVSLKANTVQD